MRADAVGEIHLIQVVSHLAGIQRVGIAGIIVIRRRESREQHQEPCQCFHQSSNCVRLGDATGSSIC